MSEDRLDSGRLQRAIGGLGWIRRLVVLDTTPSTNDEARRLAREGAPAGTVVVADRQLQGRGRVGRSWHSPPGLGLYLSVLFRPTATAEQALRWTLASAVAACDAVLRRSRAAVEIKWPNDLMANGRKLAGTLVELRSAGTRVRELVVGTGFNVHHSAEQLPAELAGTATSIALAGGGEAPSRASLLAAYLDELGRRSEQLGGGGWANLRQDWEARAPMARGAAVRVLLEGTDPLEGTTEGIDDLGGLLVRARDGRIVHVRLHDRLERI